MHLPVIKPAHRMNGDSYKSREQYSVDTDRTTPTADLLLQFHCAATKERYTYLNLRSSFCGDWVVGVWVLWSLN